jgi:hypothetical protein
LSWIDGSFRISSRNARSVTTSSLPGAVVVTVAVRGRSETSEISPKKSPEPSVLTLRPFRCTSAAPSTSTKNSRPEAPSLVSTSPAPTSISSARRAISPSSFFEHSEKSGTRFKSSSFASRRSIIPPGVRT